MIGSMVQSPVHCFMWDRSSSGVRVVDTWEIYNYRPGGWGICFDICIDPNDLNERPEFEVALRV